MLIVVGSVKGAPGATTVALGLAGMWPGPALLVEADASGGDLAPRFGHHPDPGLASLAAATRPGAAGGPSGDAAGGTAGGLAGWSVGAHVQRLRLGIDVVLAWPGDAAAAPVRAVAENGLWLVGQMAAAATVVVDVGRMSLGSPGLAIASVADHVVVVTGTGLEHQAHVLARLGWLRPAVPGRLWLLLVGGGRYSGSEVARDVGVAVLGEVPDSRWGAGVLSGRLVSPSWRRLRLSRALHGVALTLSGRGPTPRALTAPPAGAAWPSRSSPQWSAPSLPSPPPSGPGQPWPRAASPSAARQGLPYKVLGGAVRHDHSD